LAGSPAQRRAGGGSGAAVGEREIGQHRVRWWHPNSMRAASNCGATVLWFLSAGGMTARRAMPHWLTESVALHAHAAAEQAVVLAHVDRPDDGAAMKRHPVDQPQCHRWIMPWQVRRRLPGQGGGTRFRAPTGARRHGAAAAHTLHGELPVGLSPSSRMLMAPPCSHSIF
jgi:hypothetical protein